MASSRTWSTLQRLDALGLVLVVALAVWVAFFAGGGEGEPGPVLWLLAGMALAFVVGRALSWRPGLVERTVAVAVAGSVVITWPGVLDAGGAPLGYANANATLTSLGVIAAIGASRSVQRREDRRAWIGLACALAAATVSTGSVAGVSSLVVGLAVLAIGHRTDDQRFSIAAGLIVACAALGVTSAVAVGSDPLGTADLVDTREDLWTVAIELLRDAPAQGIGPGEFADRNPVSTDADLRWAHHGYLQVAAELGVVGLGLLFGLVGWSAAVLGRRSLTGALGAAALAVVVLHATVDYVFHVPAVMLVLAVMVGAAVHDPRHGRCRSWHPAPASGVGGVVD